MLREAKTKFLEIKDQSGEIVHLNVGNIDYLKQIDSATFRVIMTSGNTFTVSKDQLGDLLQ